MDNKSNLSKNNNFLKIRIMPRFKLLTQGSVLQHESGFTIGYAISNKDFELMENSLISAVGILNNHPPTAPVLSALAMIKGFSEGRSTRQ
ncbi:hypothetical protein JZU68_06790 [bacterium]|nr:hypothetical protein [bacterium]